VVYLEGAWHSGCDPKTFLKSSSRFSFKAVSSNAWSIVIQPRCALRSNRIGRRCWQCSPPRRLSGALPDDLNQILRAYMESRAVLTALELDIFTAVGAGATGEEVARKVSTRPRAEILLNALAPWGC
jgi:hypothetical protein